MRFIDYDKAGEASVLYTNEGEQPEPGRDEVLIRVVAAGVNGPDIAQRKGLYPPPPGASPVLGLEVSGVVVGIGEQVDQWRVGDPVCALVPGGGYAEFVVTKAQHCLPIPEGISLVDAAALPETLFTVWSNLVDRANLKAGETVLVHGGSGGIGTAAIQVAKSLGARVLTTVGSDAKQQVCTEIGADLAINYRNEDFVSRALEASQGKGVNVILDIVGGDYINRNFKALAVEGRLVTLALLGGSKASVNIAPLMMKRLTWTGSTLRPQSDAAKAKIAEALLDQVWPRIADGEIRPVIHEVFSLQEAEQAHRLMESSSHIGKILLATGFEG